MHEGDQGKGGGRALENISRGGMGDRKRRDVGVCSGQEARQMESIDLLIMLIFSKLSPPKSK